MEKARKLERVRGITLVALVVTIVILIILATISVNIVINGGLIDRTQKGKATYENAKNEEERTLGEVTEYANKMIEGAEGSGESAELPNITPDTPAGTKVKKPTTWISEKVIAIADGKGGLVPLPNGYYYVGGNYDEGLVISDKAGDTMDASGVDMRKSICMDTSAR